MKPLDDLSFDVTSDLEPVFRSSFEQLWREMEDRDDTETSPDLPNRWVRLDCNGELVDIGSVGLTGVRDSALCGELIKFVCPRCNEQHESLRFG
jgi:hypothetical protein